MCTVRSRCEMVQQQEHGAAAGASPVLRWEGISSRVHSQVGDELRQAHADPEAARQRESHGWVS